MLICVIDDDESVRTGTASLLRSGGDRTETFASAQLFLDSGAPCRFACIVADIQMPGMSGIELALRLGCGSSQVPVILMTGRNDPELLSSAAATSAVCVLTKPFGADRLLECVELAITRRKVPAAP